jgi:hypothetical protein
MHLRDEVGSVPVVAQGNGQDAEISQYGRDLLKVVGLLLVPVQLFVRNPLEN